MFFPVELNFARNQIICPVSFGLLSPYKKYTFEICLKFVFTFDIQSREILTIQRL